MSIAKFYHVSAEQYAADCAGWADVLPLTELPLPCRATGGAAGYDFVCPVSCTMQPGETALIPTGIRAEMETGWVLLLFPRSSLQASANLMQHGRCNRQRLFSCKERRPHYDQAGQSRRSCGNAGSGRALLSGHFPTLWVGRGGGCHNRTGRGLWLHGPLRPKGEPS